VTGHLTDDQLDALARGGVSDDAWGLAHLDSCATCLDRFVELAQLHRKVQAMSHEIEPPKDLWPTVRANIQTRVEEQPTHRASGAAHALNVLTHRWNRAWRTWPIAAAALVLLTSASIASFLLGRRSERTSVNTTLNSTRIATPGPVPESGQTATASSDSATGMTPTAVNAVSQPIEDNADIHTEQELLADLEMRRSSLRPETSSEIDSSLKVIDNAIAELRAASARDPKNATLRQLLAVSRERKIELLRQTENAS
jgi:hypothetical protein